MFIPGAVLQDRHWSSRNRAEKINRYERRPQVFRQGREVKKTNTAFVVKEESVKRDRAMPEMLRSGKKLDAEDVRMEQKAGGREDKVFVRFLHTLSL